MVLGSHVIISAYGFWLPNDPRGSWSDFVRSWELLRFGPATKVTTHASVARRPHDAALRRAAKTALRYPPVSFTGVQARAVGVGFARFLRRSGVIAWACSILPEHVHLVLARHTYDVEQIANLLKGDATRQLLAENLHPLARWAKPDGRVPCCWARHAWKVFLNSEADLLRAIRYVRENPLKEGKRIQSWSFVTPFERAHPFA
jgi:REP element-mobilizing transposase RayT